MTDLKQTTQEWIGCGECDSTFKCYGSGKECIRLPVEPTPWRDMIVVSLVREGINKHRARELADHFATQQQAGPGTREGFNAWWDSDYDDSANRFEKDSAAYWAWAGWQAAKRPWVGLTKVQQDDFADAYGSYEAVCAIEQALKERNT